MLAVTLTRKNCVVIEKDGKQVALLLLSNNSMHKDTKIAIKADDSVNIKRRDITPEDVR